MSSLADSTRLKILHMTAVVGRQSYGLGPVVMNLAKYQAHFTLSNVWCLENAIEANRALTAYRLSPDALRTFTTLGPVHFAYTPQMEREIGRAIGAQFDILHQHGIWTALSRVSNKWRATQHKPTVVTPHGSLEAWALKRSTLKKNLALLMYERQNLHEAACLHALAESEAQSFRNFGLRNPIAIIPNGLDDDWLESSGVPEEFRAKYNLPVEARLMLFVGRITPKKGLPLLMQALRAQRERLGDWLLVIAGGDEFGHQREVQLLIKQLGLTERIRFIGPVFGPDKRNAYAAAEILILPTHSEGAPMVVLEALGAGKPVLTTEGTPWQSLRTYDCGWWTPISVEGLTAALCEALAMTSERLQAMGARGQKLIRDQYRWSKIAEMTLHLYTWLLGRESQPDFVFLD